MMDKDAGIIMLCAMRYALGRETYMPGLVQGYIMRHKDELDLNTVRAMIEDINYADRTTIHTTPEGHFMVDGFGDTKIDRPGWESLREWLIHQKDCLEDTGTGGP